MMTRNPQEDKPPLKVHAGGHISLLALVTYKQLYNLYNQILLLEKSQSMSSQWREQVLQRPEVEPMVVQKWE